MTIKNKYDKSYKIKVIEYIFEEVITIKTYYIEERDKPIFLIDKFINIQLEDDVCKIPNKLNKKKYIIKTAQKLKKLMIKNDIQNVVLSKKIKENKDFLKELDNRNILVVDGRWLIKYLSNEILDYIIKNKNMKKEQTDLAILANEVTDTTVQNIKLLAKQYRKLTIVTNHIEKFKKIEEQLNKEEGIIIIVANNKKKSLLKPQIILNMDFNEEVLNRYNVNENAIIVNLEEKIKIHKKRFNGISIGDFEISSTREEIIWRKNLEKYSTKDLFEVKLYVRDSFANIRKNIKKNKIEIENLYGNNGIIDFSNNK